MSFAENEIEEDFEEAQEALEKFDVEFDSSEQMDEDSLVGTQQVGAEEGHNDSSIDLDGDSDEDLDDLEGSLSEEDLLESAPSDDDGAVDTSMLEKEDLRRLVTVFQKQISYMKNRLLTMQQELQRKDQIIENLTWRFDNGELESTNSELPASSTPEVLHQLKMKSEMIAQKTMLQNFELREQNDDLKVQLKELKEDLRNRQSTDLEPLKFDTEKKSHGRKRSMSVGAIAWLKDDDDDDLDLNYAHDDMGDVGGKSRRRYDPSLGQVADLFDEQDRLDMGFDKDGHRIAEDEQPEGQWMWLPKEPDPKAPVRNRVNPSFGGVAELFGDSTLDSQPEPQTHSAAQPSFGGVVDMFGATEEEAVEEEMYQPTTRAEQRGRKRDPSFGGVADMFADDEHSSDEDLSDMDGAPDTGRTVNVGDFMEEVGEQQPTKSSYSKKRDPSFSGIADLFDEEDIDEDYEAGNISPLDEEEKPTTSQLSTKGRSKKRDPSFSGVADLFGDESEELQEEEDSEVQEQEIQPSKPSFSSNFAVKEEAPPPVGPVVEELKEELRECQESKRRLATSLCQELDRLRGVIRQLTITTTAQSAVSKDGFLTSIMNTIG